MNEKESIKKLYVHTELSFEIEAKIECQFCGELIEDSSDASEDIDDDGMGLADRMSERAYKEGWRIVDSARYGLIGPACPECAAKKDKDR